MRVAVIVIVRVRGNGSFKRHKDTSMCVSQGRIVDDRIVSSTHTRTHAHTQTHTTHTHCFLKRKYEYEMVPCR